MKITETWLDEHIFSDPDCGGYQLSCRQLKMLCQWFPELFTNESGKCPNIISGWNKIILGKEISESRSEIFKRANAKKDIQKKRRSKEISEFINDGLTICQNIHGKKPEHPHTNFVRKIGMINGVCVKAVLFLPTNDTAVEFSFSDDKSNRRYRAECTGTYKPHEPMYGLNSVIYEVIGDNPLDKDRKKITIDDCTGQDITKSVKKLKPEAPRTKKRFLKKPRHPNTRGL